MDAKRKKKKEKKENDIKFVVIIMNKFMTSLKSVC